MKAIFDILIAEIDAISVAQQPGNLSNTLLCENGNYMKLYVTNDKAILRCNI